MAELKVKLKFLNTLPDLARKFRFASNTLDKCDSIEKKDRIKLGNNDKRIIEQNLINTDNPHIQLRKTIRIDIEIFNTTRSVLFELFRNGVGNNHLDNSDSNNYYFNRVNNDPDDFVGCVKSTRYSIHHVSKDSRILYDSYIDLEYEDEEIVKDYFYIPDNDFIDSDERETWIECRMRELEQIKFYKKTHKMTNDKLKKYVNDYMLCDLTASVSGEWLWNFLTQRLDSCAFYQIQDLARAIYEQIPEEWKPLFKVFKYKKVQIDDFLKKYLNREIEINAYEKQRFEEIVEQLLNKDLVEKEYLIK